MLDDQQLSRLGSTYGVLAGGYRRHDPRDSRERLQQLCWVFIWNPCVDGRAVRLVTNSVREQLGERLGVVCDGGHCYSSSTILRGT